MTKYLKQFELTTQYEEYINSNVALFPNVSVTNDDNKVHYNPIPNYLTFTAEQDNSAISLNSATNPDIKYSLNGGTWTQWDYSAITLNMGDTVRMKGNNSSGFSTSTSNYNQFKMTGKISASGNIMSLLYEDDFEGKLTIPCNYCFYYIFYGCTSLTTAPEIPATTLTNDCYRCMFRDCENLTTTPDLPSMKLADYCYAGMFQNCTSITITPKLPATTLVANCYYYMFRGCTNLTTAPNLPATTLANGCYVGMFYGCTGLINVPELPATTLAANCYYYMFRGCTNLKTAPNLSATTLANYCYYGMFYGCTKLNYIKMLATNISATACLSNWVKGVASTGTFIKHPNMTSLSSGTSGIPRGWTVQNAA